MDGENSYLTYLTNSEEAGVLIDMMQNIDSDATISGNTIVRIGNMLKQKIDAMNDAFKKMSHK